MEHSFDHATFSIDGKQDRGSVTFTRREDKWIQIELTGQGEAYGLFFANFMLFKNEDWDLPDGEGRVNTRDYFFAAQRRPVVGEIIYQIHIKIDRVSR